MAVNSILHRDFGSDLKRLLRHMRHPGSLPQLVWKNFRYVLKSADANSTDDDPGTWNELGRALAERGRYHDALTAYDHALAIRSDMPQVLNNRGNALRAIGRLVDAEASLRGALQLKTDFANAHNNLGTVLFDLDRFTEAETSFRNAIQFDPSVPGFHK